MYIGYCANRVARVDIGATANNIAARTSGSAPILSDAFCLVHATILASRFLCSKFAIATSLIFAVSAGVRSVNFTLLTRTQNWKFFSFFLTYYMEGVRELPSRAHHAAIPGSNSRYLPVKWLSVLIIEPLVVVNDLRLPDTKLRSDHGTASSNHESPHLCDSFFDVACRSFDQYRVVNYRARHYTGVFSRDRQ